MLQFRFVYVYTIATDAPAAATRLMAASGDRSNGTLTTSKTSSAMTRIDRKSANLCLRNQAKRLEKLLLLLRTTPRLTALRTVYFPAITRNGFYFHMRKIIFRWPWPPPKNRDIHIVVFFVDSIYSKTIDIIRKNILFLFLDRGPMCKAWHTAHGINLQVSFLPAAAWRYHFAGSVLTRTPDNSIILQKMYSRIAG